MPRLKDFTPHIVALAIFDGLVIWAFVKLVMVWGG